MMVHSPRRKPNAMRTHHHMMHITDVASALPLSWRPCPSPVEMHILRLEVMPDDNLKRTPLLVYSNIFLLKSNTTGMGAHAIF